MKSYHYSDGQKSYGPVTLEELRSINIKANTLIWTASLVTWTEAKEVPELQDLFPQQTTQATPTIPPPYPQYPFNKNIENARPPKTYLVESIITTIICCWLLGIPAIIYASRVEKKYYAGDISGAESDSANAKKWIIINLVACAAIWVLGLGIFGLGALGSLL